MKVILKQDLAKIGRRFDIVDVPNGYALNKLIPQGMAEPATKEAVKRIQSQKQAQAADMESIQADFLEAVEKLKTATIQVSVEANEQGHLFKQLKVEDIIAAAAGQGIALLESQVVIDEPIKSVGEHQVTLTSGDQTVTATINVTAN